MDGLGAIATKAATLNWQWQRHELVFINPAKTSRDTLRRKNTWFLKCADNDGEIGIGEISTIEGLSLEKGDDLEKQIAQFCAHPEEYLERFVSFSHLYPAFVFGLEMALSDFNSGQAHQHFPTPFSQEERPIAINGLIWMGEKKFMFEQIKQKLDQGFDCIKLKVGGIDFGEECELLAYVRQQFGRDEVELRLDANGAFTKLNPLKRLQTLSQYDIHSIEQPVFAGHTDLMANLCASSPIPIALDEELIGISETEEKETLLKKIRPQYIILKPSLVGGWKASDEWIDIAQSLGIDYWATSALESNIGLNAIAQWISTKGNPIWQGLGTGSLYHNNIPSPLEVNAGKIRYLQNANWEISLLEGNWKKGGTI